MQGKDQLRLIEVDAAWMRALLLVPLALALYGVWTAGRWAVGNILASDTRGIEIALAFARTRPNDPAVRKALEEIDGVLAAAEEYAPSDPQVQFTLATLARKTLDPAEFPEALAHYERAAALSPHDYRLWMELGRVRGQAGDFEGGERALRHAAALAPHYSLPRWHLGNLLLRAGREREAFEELRRAGAADPRLHTQIFTTAWSYFGGDLRSVASAVGDSPDARARLVSYLVSQKRADEAADVWATLRPEDKRAQAEAGRNLSAALVAAGRARRGLEVFRESTGSAQNVSVGQITNGGFETDTGGPASSPFDWVIKTAPQAQVGLDTRVAHAGRSVRILFSAPNDFNLGQFSQLVLVEPQARYRLSYFLRAEDMKGVATVFVEVLANGQRLAAGPSVPPGSSDWRAEEVEFNVPAQAEAVEVRIARAPCPEQPCPVFGKLWYDDFNLQRVGAGAAGNRAAQAR